MPCACTTCHVVVREGFNALEPSDEVEDDLLDKAWGLEPNSRLSCQAMVTETSLVIEIPLLDQYDPRGQALKLEVRI